MRNLPFYLFGVYVGGLFAAIIGWVLNFMDLIGSLGGPITAMFVARCVGVFAFPLGAILGYF